MFSNIDWTVRAYNSIVKLSAVPLNLHFVADSLLLLVLFQALYFNFPVLEVTE